MGWVEISEEIKINELMEKKKWVNQLKIREIIQLLGKRRKGKFS